MVTAMVIRFTANCLSNVKKSGNIDVDEKEDAMVKWVKVVQSDYFKEEIQFLKRNGEKEEQPSLVRQLRLFLDTDGIVRCQGRLKNAVLPDAAKYPILLPKASWLVRLVV